MSLQEMISNDDFKAKMEEAKKAGDKETARNFAQKHVRQKKVQTLLKTYKTIFKSIVGK